MKLIKREDIASFTDNGRFTVGLTNGIQTILGNNGVKGGKVKLYMHCKKCEKDPELYEDGIFEITRSQAEIYKGCGCGNVKHEEWQYKLMIERVCTLECYIFHGWVGEYKGASTKLDLECPEGYRYQSANITKFLRCGRRCPHCAKMLPWSLERFLKEAKAVHGDRYDYSLITEVVNCKQKLPIICKKHGVFYSDCTHHIRRSQDCPHPECCWGKISEVKASNTEEFVIKAKKVHGDNYGYEKTIYTRSFNKVGIYCPLCKKYFHQNAADHLSGNGCPSCAGRNQLQCYIFKIKSKGDTIALKVGKANHYKSRYTRQRGRSVYDVEVFGVWGFKTTEACAACEKRVLSKLPCEFLSKEEYPDGYSETVDVKYTENVVEIYEGFGGERTV